MIITIGLAANATATAAAAGPTGLIKAVATIEAIDAGIVRLRKNVMLDNSSPLFKFYSLIAVSDVQAATHGNVQQGVDFVAKNLILNLWKIEHIYKLLYDFQELQKRNHYIL